MRKSISLDRGGEAQIRPRDIRDAAPPDGDQQLIAFPSFARNSSFSVDHAWRLVSIEDSAAKFLRVAPSEVIGEPFWDFAFPLFGSGLKAKLHAALRRQQVTEFDHLCGTSKRTWLKVTCEPFDGGLRIFLRDITSQKIRERWSSRLNTHLLQASDAERRLVARELHDMAAQDLAVALMDVEDLQRKSDAEDGTTAERFDELRTVLNRTLVGIRLLSCRLHPPLLDEAGILPAAKWVIRGFQKRTGMKVSLSAPPELPRLSDPVEETVFRIIEESLSNLARHARTKSAKVSLALVGETLKVEIEEIDRDSATPSMLDASDRAAPVSIKLAQVWARARQLHGQFKITRTSGGTKVSLALPILAFKRAERRA